MTAPKRLASSTSTAANRNGAASFQWVRENNLAKAIAQTALRVIPRQDCRVQNNFVFICLLCGGNLFYGHRNHAINPEVDGGKSREDDHFGTAF